MGDHYSILKRCLVSGRISYYEFLTKLHCADD